MHLAGREYKVFTLKRFRISSFYVPKRTHPCDSYASTGSIVHVKEKESVRAIEAHSNYYVLEKVAPASLEWPF